MTRHLVIGGRGLVGSAICRELSARAIDYWSTTRAAMQYDEDSNPREFYLDLENLNRAVWPTILGGVRKQIAKLGGLEVAGVDVPVVYLAAAMSGVDDCEGSYRHWRVNVDAQIALARKFKDSSFIVYVSSFAVERSANAYARMKSRVEGYIDTIDGAIIRAKRVTTESSNDLGKLIVNVAVNRTIGVHEWP